MTNKQTPPAANEKRTRRILSTTHHDALMRVREDESYDEPVACAACCGRGVLMNTLANIANGESQDVPCPRCSAEVSS